MEVSLIECDGQGCLNLLFNFSYFLIKEYTYMDQRNLRKHLFYNAKHVKVKEFKDST